MSKVLALIAIFAVMWAVKYFAVCIIGLCFGVTTTTALQATGVLVALLYVRVMWGGSK